MSDRDEFYDRKNVLARYLAHRGRPDNPNDTLDRPIFREMVGELRGLDVIDLGCGDARLGVEAIQEGARSYHGIEVSRAMFELARENLGGGLGTVEHLSMENWRPRPDAHDLVASRLALNYVEDLSDIFRKVYSALRPGGRLALSVEHPVITSNFQSFESGVRTNWLVDDYFRPGPRPHKWLGQEVIKYHRTIEEYPDLVREGGLSLERLRESRPSPENFQSQEEYRRRLRIPLFLFIAARKAD
ncbi:MAG: methyltransferase domain-containing protein [Trueperaceae bacterium]